MTATDEHLADTLVPIAARLVGTVREYGPDDVAAVLGMVPDGRYDALAVVLAAMVDPDSTPKELLAWTHSGLEYHRLIAAGVNARTAAILAADKADVTVGKNRHNEGGPGASTPRPRPTNRCNRKGAC